MKVGATYCIKARASCHPSAYLFFAIPWVRAVTRCQLFAMTSFKYSRSTESTSQLCVMLIAPTWCREWSGAHQAGETMCLPACSAHCALWVPREEATTCVTCSSSSVVQEQPYVSASFQSWCSLGACSRGNTLENSTLTPGSTCPGEAPNQNPTLVSSHQQSG